MDRENGSSLATFSLVAVIVVVALIALFVWQPWNQTTRANGTSTSVTTPVGQNGTTTQGTTTTNTTSGGTH
ncbi:MAG TPA: hypothetical protein VHT53_11820 [Candidatus Elarobacter sp.]|nr:hypothetical protein [Candidatus Elarobacter sp.]